MPKLLVAASIAALLAAVSPPAFAQAATGAHDEQQFRGSHRSETQHRRGEVHRRARAGAEHARQARQH